MTTATTGPPEEAVTEQVAQLEARLEAEHDELPPTLVHDCVEQARSQFAQARIHTFLPILIERAARAALGRTPLPARSRATAEHLLTGDLPGRWQHTRGVAERAAEVAAILPREDQPVLLSAAWLHDIGYAPAVADTGLHQLDGARYLARHRVPRRVCALVAHHAGAVAVAELVGLSAELAEFTDEVGPTRDALWYCDMTTSPDGERVTFDERMAELRARRGPDDPVVRALVVNESERAAAVRRTEERLAAQPKRPWT